MKLSKEDLDKQLKGEKPIKAYLAPDVILKFLVGNDEKTNKLFDMEQKDSMRFIISNYALYEAVQSLNEGELILNNLKKLLYVTEFMVFPAEKSIEEFFRGYSFEERKGKLRKIAGLE